MTTYYVSTSGSDGAAGTAYGTAWATIQKAADTATAGDLVLICADGTHTPSASVDFDTNSGTSAAPIVFRGAASDGTDDGTVATVTGASISSAPLFRFQTATGGRYVEFHNLRLTAGTASCVSGINSQYGIWFIDCTIDSATGWGILFDNAGSLAILLRTEVYGNSSGGLGQTTSSRGSYICHGCSIHDNGGPGISAGGNDGIVIVNSLVYDNTGDGLFIDSKAFVSNCTIANNGGDGLDLSSASVPTATVVNTIVANNGAYGVFNNSTTVVNLRMANCIVYNNTSGATDNATGLSALGYDISTSDPGFTSTTDGSEDYSVSSGGSAKATGWPGAITGGTGYMDIGAIQRQESASGGGGSFIISG